MKRYGFLLICGFTFLVFLCDVRNIQAQAKYPNRAIELVVPFSPGGSNDLYARIYSAKLAQILKNQVIVVNRGAGGGIQGVLYAARAKKDGYTLLACGPSMVINSMVSKEATYSPLKNFIPLGFLGSSPMVLAVRSDSPFKTFSELIDYARKNPDKLKNSDGGGVSASYLNIELMRAKDIKITLIPFTGGGEATLALLGGHVDMTFSTIMNSGPHIKSGKLRPLAITSKKRFPLFPDIPTTAELGHPYVAFNGWAGTFAPSGMPQAAVDVLVPGLAKTFKDPEVAKKLADAYVTADYLGPEEFRKLIESETVLIAKIIKDTGLQAK